MFTPNLQLIYNMFRFKQFNVDQSGCAMKINTDGVLLGALAKAKDPVNILDIGTGTGVIALMLAQRFPSAVIDAVEIDKIAAATAARNFANSVFNERLAVFPTSFEQYFKSNTGKKYDLIVANPPFYINSLKSPEKNKQLAKHADIAFFEQLINALIGHLDESGQAWLVLPISTSEIVKEIAAKQNLATSTAISVYSYANSEAHREIIMVSRSKIESQTSRFIIYDSPGIYSEQYRNALKDFFTIF